jgi:DNA polymerase-3 subunit epsilon
MATYEVLDAQIARYGDIGDTVAELAEFSTREEVVDFAGRIALNDKGEEVFTFGKYRGCKVEEIFRKEPSYYKWMMDGDFPQYTKKVITEIRLRIK